MSGLVTSLGLIGHTGAGNAGAIIALVGAVGDGVTDDTAAFNTAIAALPATGGAILLEAGKRYAVNLTITKNNVTIIGQHAGSDGNIATGFTAFSASSPAITVGNGTTQLLNFRMMWCRVYSQSGKQKGLLVNGAADCMFVGCEFGGFTTYSLLLTSGSATVGTYYTYFLGCKFFATSAVATSGFIIDTLYGSGFTTTCHLIGCNIDGSALGTGAFAVRVRDQVQLWTAQTDFQLRNGKGIVIEGTGRLHFDGGEIDTSDTPSTAVLIQWPSTENSPNSYLHGQGRINGCGKNSVPTTFDLRGTNSFGRGWFYGPTIYQGRNIGALELIDTGAATLAGAYLMAGGGSPEGSRTAPIGSIFVSTNNSGGENTVWIKESGAGNTGWRRISTGDYTSRVAANVASAATCSIGAADGRYVFITGNVTITALGTADFIGVRRTVQFSGAPLLTHNATSLYLPGTINIQTVAGDVAEFIYQGSGNWRCIGYQRVDGTALTAGGGGTLAIVGGGTGQTTAGPAKDALTIKGADIASASTTNLATATGDFVHVTGTTTITALGTAAAGVQRVVEFTGALTLTHNATTLILPTAANIVTVAGDCAAFRSEGSGNWRCVSYTRADGTALTAGAGGAVAIASGGTAATTAVGAHDNLSTKGADIASAATTDLATATGFYVDITGTTTITAFGTVAAGAERVVRFTGILTLTHNATSLILPTAANITTAVGDVARLVSLGSGNWRCVAYTRADGTALSAGSGTVAIANGGTGQTTAVAGLDALTVQGVDIASAATTNIAAATGALVNITGTTTITAFGTAAAGVVRYLRFVTGLTLTHNATSLILPGGANIITGASDSAIAVSLGSGNWQVVSHRRAGGIIITTDTTGTLTAAKGGTNVSTWVKGEMLAASASGTLAKVVPNTTVTKNVLTETGDGSAGALPVFQDLDTVLGLSAATGGVARTGPNAYASWKRRVCDQLTIAPTQTQAAGFATIATVAGGGEPAITVKTIDFDQTTTEYIALSGRLNNVLPASASAKLKFRVACTGATTGSIAFKGMPRKVNGVDIDTTAFTYATNATSSGSNTVNATAGIDTDFEITFTTGTNMNSLVAGDEFHMLLWRDTSIGSNAAADARVKVDSISFEEA